MIHLVAFSPDNTELLEQLCLACAPGDQLVLMHAACAFAGDATSLAALPAECELFILAESKLETPASSIQTLDHDNLIELTEQQATILSWFD